jgi:hypothetical protein
MEQYKRHCPKCNTLKVYKGKVGWERAVAENRLCIRCVQIGKKHTDEVKKKIGRSVTK